MDKKTVERCINDANCRADKDSLFVDNSPQAGLWETLTVVALVIILCTLLVPGQ